MKRTQLSGFDGDLESKFPCGGEDEDQRRGATAADTGFSGHSPAVLAVSPFFTNQYLEGGQGCVAGLWIMWRSYKIGQEQE